MRTAVAPIRSLPCQGAYIVSPFLVDETGLTAVLQHMRVHIKGNE